MATATRKNTDEVLAAARRELNAQLSVVRETQTRLSREERALTQALSSLGGSSGAGSPAAASATASPASSAKAGRGTRKTSTRKASTRRRRRTSATKPTADRVKELQGLLADGPKSRNDLAAALKVSPARVQQLLAQLGTKVSSQVVPDQRSKLWTLKGSANGASAAKATGKRGTGTGASTRKASPRKTAAK